MAELLIQKYLSKFVIDPWLSKMMGKGVYKLTVDEVLMPLMWEQLPNGIPANAFVYAKVGVENIGAVRFLEEQGFHLIETNIVFEKKIEPKAVLVNGVTIRYALAEDKVGVQKVARGCFSYSRFHRDPAIGLDMANCIKEEWVANYFEGKRGNAMVVAQKEDAIIGFLQLIEKDQDSIMIDLIGVDKSFRQNGVATAMIRFAEAQSSHAVKIAVGTQIVNIPSIQCYERIGFRLAQAFYVFHYHGQRA